MEPFQIVRMESSNCTWNVVFLPPYDDWRCARSGRSGTRESPRIARTRPTSSRMRTAGGRSPGARPIGSCRSSPTGCWPSGWRRATRSASSRATASSGRSSTSRSRTWARWRLRSTLRTPPAECAYVLEHANAVGCLVDDDELRAEDRGGRPRARLRARAPRRAPCARPRARRETPRRGRAGSSTDRRRRPLHVDLHVRDDRAAEGLHDPQPQLLRHGRHDRRDRVLLPPDGCLAAVPAARAQLRPADAPARGAPRIHDRVPR